MNFRKVPSLYKMETGGVCELNERGAVSFIGENEDLKYEKETVYIQFQDIKVSLDSEKPCSFSYRNGNL